MQQVYTNTERFEEAYEILRKLDCKNAFGKKPQTYKEKEARIALINKCASIALEYWEGNNGEILQVEPH